MGIFAQFERAIIQERIASGLARVRAEGKRLGRPPVEGDEVEAARTALANGASLRKAANASGLGLSVIRRLKAEAVE